MVIDRKTIPDGLLLRVKPFRRPNRNAACEIMARIISSQGTRRDVQVVVCNLNNLMALSDVRILMTALRALTDEAEGLMDEVQETARKKSVRKKATKKKTGTRRSPKK